MLIRLVPGDPIEVRVGEHGIAPERLAELRHEFGLDQPLWKQFLDYEKQVVHRRSRHVGGDARAGVDRVHARCFPPPSNSSLCAILFAMLVGLPLGVIAAVKRGSAFDYGLMGLSVTGASMPIFWWGLMMILVFSVGLGWTPVSGRISDMYYVEPWTGFMLIDCLVQRRRRRRSARRCSHLILPTIVLGTIPLAIIARMTRSAMLEVLGEDYIRTARAKGLAAVRVVDRARAAQCADPGGDGDRACRSARCWAGPS